jgi:hypothetical protein
MNAKQLHKRTLFCVAGLAMVLMATVALISGCGQNFANADRVVSVEEGQLTTAEENGRSEKTHEVADDAEVVIDGQLAALEDLDSGDSVKLTTEEQDGVEVVKKIDAKSKEAVEAEEAEADKSTIDSPIDSPTAPIGPLTDPPLSDVQKDESGLNDPYSETPEPAEDQPIDAEDGAPQAENINPYEEADDAEEALAEESFSGTISSLDDDQVVIKDDSDMEHTFMVNDDTKYTLDGNEATFDQLMVDHSVNATAEKDGDNYVAKMVDATSDDSSR